MDENNNSNNNHNSNDSKRSRTSTRSPGGDDCERSRSEHSVELTLPPKKSAKHYNRKAAKLANSSSSSSTSPGVVVPSATATSNGRSASGRSGVDCTSDKENYCDTITGDGPYQQMRLPDGQMVLMLQPHYVQLAAALGINAHDGMNQLMDFESLIELSRKHQHMVSGQ